MSRVFFVCSFYFSKNLTKLLAKVKTTGSFSIPSSQEFYNNSIIPLSQT